MAYGVGGRSLINGVDNILARCTETTKRFLQSSVVVVLTSKPNSNKLDKETLKVTKHEATQ